MPAKPAHQGNARSADCAPNGPPRGADFDNPDADPDANPDAILGANANPTSDDDAEYASVEVRSIKVGRYALVECRRAPKSSGVDGNGNAGASACWSIAAVGAADGATDGIEGSPVENRTDDRRRRPASESGDPLDAKPLLASSINRHSCEQYKPACSGSSAGSSSITSMTSSRTGFFEERPAGCLVVLPNAATLTCDRRLCFVATGIRLWDKVLCIVRDPADVLDVCEAGANDDAAGGSTA